MSAPVTRKPQRRGVCPGLSAPMPTGDGLLARLSTTGTIPLIAFAALCEAARTYGNGVVEVTSRGSVQVRGLSEASASPFADAIAALDIAAADGVPVLCNALAGLDADEIFDSTSFARNLRQRIAQGALAARLSPKVSIVIDDGGTIGLDAVAADIRLRAERRHGDVTIDVGVGGDDSHAAKLGSIAPSYGVEAAIGLLDVIARHGREARARDVLATEGVKAFHASVRGLSRPARPRESGDPELDSRLRGNERSTPVGTFPLRDGTLAVGTGLAFGHTDSNALERLVDAAATAGAIGLRTAPGRALLAIGVAPGSAAALTSRAENLGFITRADDPRRGVIACPGAPVCASAHIASRALAPVIAADVVGLNGIIHISGCAKGCAHAAAAALTIVGTAEGCAMIADGIVGDAPFAVVPESELRAAVRDHVRKRHREAAHV
jgi:precorrin-3B synthase